MCESAFIHGLALL